MSAGPMSAMELTDCSLFFSSLWRFRPEETALAPIRDRFIMSKGFSRGDRSLHRKWRSAAFFPVEELKTIR